MQILELAAQDEIIVTRETKQPFSLGSKRKVHMMIKVLGHAVCLSALVFVFAASSANAEPNYYANGFQTTPGVPAAPPDNYQGPGGHYDSPADFIRSLNGTPCGMECSERARLRWGLPNPNR